MNLRMLLILLCGLLPLSGGAQTGAIAGTMAVSSLISELKNGANDVLNNTQNVVTRGAFEVRQNTELLLSQLQILTQEVGDRTFAQLNDAQKKFFADSRALLAEWKAGVGLSIEKANALMGAAESALATIPGADRTARVLGFGPRYIVGGGGASSFRIKVQGSWLGTDEPSLAVENGKAQLLTKTERELEFSCEATTPAAPKVQPLKTTLTVVDRRSFFQKIGGWFSDNKVRRTYNLTVFVVPAVIGTFSADVSVNRPSEEFQPKSETRRADNEHCVGSRRYSWQVNATSGWSIVDKPATRRVGDGDAVDEGVQSWSPTGFVISGIAKNSGECFGLIKDGRGHVEIEATWREKRTVMKPSREKIAVGDIRWGEERRVDLPDGVAAVTLHGTLANAQKTVDDANASRKWYAVTVDVPNKAVIIRPKAIDDALSD